jgi:hypothetical protein
MHSKSKEKRFMRHPDKKAGVASHRLQAKFASLTCNSKVWFQTAAYGRILPILRDSELAPGQFGRCRPTPKGVRWIDG